MAKHPKTVSFDRFKGINNQLKPEKTPIQFLKEALNVDLDKLGGITKREGYTKLFTGQYHSLWSSGSQVFAVKDGTLVRIKPNLTEEVSLSFTTEVPLSFGSEDGRIFFASEDGSFEIINDQVVPWGLPHVNPRPNLITASGGLTAGVYQVACTYVADDGREGGVGLSTKITVQDDGGIMLFNIPTTSHPSVSGIRIYCSTPDGEMHYLVDEIPLGTSSYTITAVSEAMLPLQSFNNYPAPAGQLMTFAHQRAWVAQDNILWFSEPYSYDRWNFHTNFFVYPDKITNLMPVDSGMWVCSDSIYYLAGDDTDKMSSSMKEPVKAVQGTEVRIPGPYVFMENTPLGYKWLVTTDRGIFICFNQGVILNMTESNFSFPQAEKGAGIFIQKDGINKYVPVLQKKKDSENTTVGDQVTGVIIRNGVTLEE